MSFDNEQIKYMRAAVEIDKMTTDELLNLDEAAIRKMSYDNLISAMTRMTNLGVHIKPEEGGFDRRYIKYLNRAGELEGGPEKSL